MSWWSNSVLFNLIVFLLIIVFIALAYIKWSFTYFKRSNLPYLEPKLLYGNLEAPSKNKTAPGIIIKRLYDQIKSKQLKYCGVYFSFDPILMITDLNLLKLIMTKDFDHFTDRGDYYNEKDDPLSAHLFAIGGAKWRNLRVKLSPTFSSGKLKAMFNILTDCGDLLKNAMDEKYAKHEPVDIKQMLECFTTDVIGSCAFGLECNSFKNVNTPFRVHCKKIFLLNHKRRLVRMITRSFPQLGLLMKMKRIPTDVSEFFMKVVKDTVDYRETNNFERKDFLQLLIEIKNKPAMPNNDTSLTIQQIAAQSFVFFIAGFETSSTLMAFTLYELAKHQDIQDKVRQEIIDVVKKHNGQITYDSINDLKYLNQVLDESLRKYPPVPFLARKCVKDYKLVEFGTTIKKGYRVGIPIIGIHNDPEYYPEPEKFDPERFSEKNKQNRHPYAFIPFGEGPRICIGMRFGLMQSKVGIVSLLKHYKFSLNPKTKQPLKMAANSLSLLADGGIWLDVKNL